MPKPPNRNKLRILKTVAEGTAEGKVLLYGRGRLRLAKAEVKVDGGSLAACARLGLLECSVTVTAAGQAALREREHLIEEPDDG